MRRDRAKAAVSTRPPQPTSARAGRLLGRPERQGGGLAKMIWVMNREGQWVQTPAASFDDIEEKIDVPVTLPRYCLTERVASDTAYVDSSDEAARGPSESADADCCDANVCGLSAGSTAQALPDDDANLECGAAAAFACFHPTPTEDDYESGEPVFLKVYQFTQLD